MTCANAAFLPFENRILRIVTKPGSISAMRSSPGDIPVLSRAIRVLGALAGPGMHTAKSLAMDLRIPPATCYRILNTLAAANWLRRHANGTYSLSYGLALLGALSPQMSVVLAAVAEPLRELAFATNLSAKLSVRDGDDWLMIARHELPKDLSVTQRVGARGPVTQGSTGAALIASAADDEIERLLNLRQGVTELERQRVWSRVRMCRGSDYAIDPGETHPVLSALSVPVKILLFDTEAALTVFGMAEELPVTSAKRVAARLQRTRRELEKAFRAMLGAPR